MENILQDTPPKNWQFLKDNLTGKDVTKIATSCDCSPSTVYNYLKEEISNKFLAHAIYLTGVQILSDRNIIVPQIENK